MKCFYFVPALIFVNTCVWLCSCQTLNQSMELMSNNLKHYDRRLRPTINQSLPTIVDVSFVLLGIEEFSEIDSKLSLTGILYMTWMDEKISWDHALNHNITSQIFPANEVWHPVLILSYPHGKIDDFLDDWMTVRIYHTGFATLGPGAVFQSKCSVDITYYPFDVQTCSLVFIPWMYTASEISLHLTNPHINGQFYIEHGEWEIIENFTSYAFGIENLIQFTFKFQRKPLFFVINIIMPIIILSLLNILVFVLPPETGERVSYATTVLLAIAVFLTLVGDHLPKTSKPISALSYYLMCNLALSALMCVCTIFNLRLYFRDDNTNVPTWIKCIFQMKICGRCRRRKNTTPSANKHVSHPECTDIKIAECNVKKDANIHIIDEEDCVYEVTWRDVSKKVDCVCLLLFFGVTVGDTISFLLSLILKPIQ